MTIVQLKYHSDSQFHSKRWKHDWCLYIRIYICVDDLNAFKEITKDSKPGQEFQTYISCIDIIGKACLSMHPVELIKRYFIFTSHFLPHIIQHFNFCLKNVSRTEPMYANLWPRHSETDPDQRFRELHKSCGECCTTPRGDRHRFWWWPYLCIIEPLKCVCAVFKRCFVILCKGYTLLARRVLTRISK